MKNIVAVFSCVFLSIASTASAQYGIDYKSPPKPYVPGGMAEEVDSKPGFALRSRSSPERIEKAVAKKKAAEALKAEQLQQKLEFIEASKNSKGPNCGVGRTVTSMGGWCKPCRSR